MRNGRHESNAPSRFLRDIDSRYLDRPLEDEDFDNDGVRHEWGGFGSRWSGGRLDRFQRQSGDREIPPLRSAPVGMTGAHKTGKPGYGSVISSAGAAGVEKSPGKPSAPADPDFVPSPMTAFKPGMRIEHNRFGPGEILEITGVVPELKARVRFDELGEKLLLLKYAKMRPEQK
jgi:DNA helicase-2/ATP-dependent DNA helicase PcrA